MTTPPPLTPVAPEPPAQRFAATLDLILMSLLAFIGARFRTLGDITFPLSNRVSRARQRLMRLLAHLAAGRLLRQRPPRPGRKGGARSPYISRRQGWLIHALRHDPMCHNAVAHGLQLACLLNDPATQALLAAAPPAALNSLGRTLRPLCRQLGIAVPPPLQPVPRPPVPRRPTPPRAKLPRAKPPSLHPRLPQYRPRDMSVLPPRARKNGPV